jgi:predicted small metal-binding protein
VEKTLTCDCGFEAHAADDGLLAVEVRRHAWQTHGMTLSHEDALLLVFRGDLSRLPTAPPATRTEPKEER